MYEIYSYLMKCINLVPNNVYYDINYNKFTELTPIIVNGNTRISESVSYYCVNLIIYILIKFN